MRIHVGSNKTINDKTATIIEIDISLTLDDGK